MKASERIQRLMVLAYILDKMAQNIKEIEKIINSMALGLNFGLMDANMRANIKTEINMD